MGVADVGTSGGIIGNFLCLALERIFFFTLSSFLHALWKPTEHLSVGAAFACCGQKARVPSTGDDRGRQECGRPAAAAADSPGGWASDWSSRLPFRGAYSGYLGTYQQKARPT